MQPISSGQLLHAPPAFAPPAPDRVVAAAPESAAAAVDGATSALLLATVRTLMRVGTREEVVGALMDAVRDLGGSVTSSAHQGPTTINIDLSFGIGGPLLAFADRPEVHAVLRAELPPLIEDAQLAIERIEQSPVSDPGGVTDPLTGLGNWTFTLRILERMSTGDAVAIIELENLKHINDYFSPATGDQVILSFARTLRRVARAADAVGRVGGTEFVWLFRNATALEAESAVLRLRSTWEAERTQEEVTFSAGVAAVTVAGPSEAYVYADVALENARRVGPNTTFVSQ
ncbi:MAG TPA: GGDEF domain-containing protein [Ilumatobacteraceae bacterium]|jgi:diguanylate cyclase (GGDEF)-like protein